MKILIRASYPNYQMIRRYAECGPEVFNRNVDDLDNVLEGNKPGTVIYTLDGDTEQHEFPPRWYDMFLLLRSHSEQKERLLKLLLAEKDGSATPDQIAQLATLRQDFHKKILDYVRSHPLYEDDEIITPLSPKDFTIEEISYKGKMLLDLTRNCYPVPDFVILTSQSFKHPEHLEEKLAAAIANLKIMIGNNLDGEPNPLVFAIRCAMPQYIPGLMPTLLNIGVTKDIYQKLCKVHGCDMANRVYLSTLNTLCEMLGIEQEHAADKPVLSIQAQQEIIARLESQIIAAREDGNRLLTDAFYQTLKLVLHIRKFYIDNQDLILTFMQGKQASPSLILQRMVWTIGNDQSYPGVLYSRNSRTGKGSQIESYRNIFGEEIMTGDVSSEDTAYTNRDTIKQAYPAVYHFHPLLVKLEERYKSPVTIEFAVETRPGKVSLFSVLQLNMSEMTGPAALISAIDLLHEGRIDKHHVMNIIKPYHTRQIVSAAIDPRSIQKLQFFECPAPHRHHHRALFQSRQGPRNLGQRPAGLPLPNALHTRRHHRPGRGACHSLHDPRRHPCGHRLPWLRHPSFYESAELRHPICERGRYLQTGQPRGVGAARNGPHHHLQSAADHLQGRGRLQASPLHQVPPW